VSTFLLQAACARDLGTIGPTYPISEPDMLVQIQDVLRAKEASGELAKIQREARERIVRQAATPAPVAGLRRAQVPRSFHFDPSVRFEEPIVDHEGRVLIAAGTAANPLSVVSLRETWLFFDARDARQVSFVQAQLVSSPQPIKPILVGGSPMELMRQWKRPVFFDQGGRITARLGLQAVPSRVRQDGDLLLIEEIPAP
jgi:conjugal transfer pilus assembly protein TraW